MERKKELTFSTGEFAAFFGIKKDTLFYYDKIKLFCPAGVSANGYRYYTASQIGPFGTLLALREMKMSIAEIRAYFRNQSAQQLRDMAAAQLAKTTGEIQKLYEIKRLFEQIVTVTQDGLSADAGQVTIQTLPPEHLLYSSQRIGGLQENPQRWWDIYSSFLQETGSSGAVYVGSVIAQDKLEAGQYGQIDRLFIRCAGTEHAGVFREGGDYAVIYHKGDYDGLPKTYDRLLAEIRRLGWLIDGNAYEEYPIAELASSRVEEYVTKISVKVKKQPNG